MKTFLQFLETLFFNSTLAVSIKKVKAQTARRNFSRLQQSCFSALFLFFSLQLAAQPVWQSSTSAVGSATSASVAIPTGVVAGDLLIMTIAFESGDGTNLGTPTAPTGSSWTQIIRQNQAGDVGIAAYWRTAVSGDANLPTSISTVGKKWSIAISRVTGADNCTPINVFAGSNADSKTFLAPSVTPTFSNTLIFAVFAVNKPGNGSDVNTERYDAPNSDGPGHMGATYVQATAVATSTRDAKFTAGADKWAAIQFAINPTRINTAGAASSTPTLCINTALTNITHTTTRATGIGTATGLPAGVTAAWASNTITISGTPTASGTFNYSIPLTGGCGSVNATGTITVTAAMTAGVASSTPTLCINTALTAITRTTTGATGIGTATGLPANVTAAWASNTITISGTPTASGTFNYSIPLTGGCGTVNATGTITVSPAPSITGSSELFVNSTTELIGSGTPASSNPWVSSNSAVVSIANGGIIKGISSGSTANITYTNSNACSAVKSITVSDKIDFEYFTPSGTEDVTSRSIPNQTNSPTYFTRDNARWVKFKMNSSLLSFHKMYADSDQSGFNVDYRTATDEEIVSNYTSSSASGITTIELKLIAPILNIGSELNTLLVQTKNANGDIFTNAFQLDVSALPVTLSSFTAKQTTDNKVALAWVTSSESVNKGFSIERQEEGSGKFQSLGFIASKAEGGNSQTTLAYSFKDVTAKNGTNMYRLVQEDLDGTKTYSEVRVVKLNGQSVSMVFPNPSTGVVNISRTADGKKMNIQVIDQSGRIVSQVSNITDANYRMNLPQSGIYNIKLMYPETSEQSIQRIVVQK